MTPELQKYALGIAKAVAVRSNDPYRQVGAVIFNKNNRIISTGYNGLAPGIDVHPDFWADKEKRRPFMIHAEVNALSYIKRDAGHTLVCTLKPCHDCLKVCMAHNIKHIYYGEDKYLPLTDALLEYSNIETFALIE